MPCLRGWEHGAPSTSVEGPQLRVQFQRLEEQLHLPKRMRQQRTWVRCVSTHARLPTSTLISLPHLFAKQVVEARSLAPIRSEAAVPVPWSETMATCHMVGEVGCQRPANDGGRAPKLTGRSPPEKRSQPPLQEEKRRGKAGDLGGRKISVSWAPYEGA